MSEAFHLTARELDAYLPERATSNTYSRPRIEVKQRAVAWGKAVLARLAEHAANVDLTPSDEVPSLRNGRRVDCQWVLFRRDQATRDRIDPVVDHGRPMSELLSGAGWYRRHAFLALRVDAASVRVGFGLHPDARVDVENVRAALESNGSNEQPHERAGASFVAEVWSALRGLPEQFTVGPTTGGADLPADDALVPTTAVTEEATRDLLERVAGGKAGLWVGWTVSRDVALTHSEILGEQLEDATLALVPVYRALSWSPERDWLRMDERLERIRRERDEAHAEAAADKARWEERRRTDLERARSKEREAPTLATLFGPRRSAVSPVQTEAREDGMVGTEARPLRQQPGQEDPRKSDPGEGRTRSDTLEPGARVRVRSGVFGGRQGVVAELDGRGGARVLFGLLSTRIDVGDLEPATLARPAIMSSHLRRPLAAKPAHGQASGPAAGRKAR